MRTHLVRKQKEVKYRMLDATTLCVCVWRRSYLLITHCLNCTTFPQPKEKKKKKNGAVEMQSIPFQKGQLELIREEGRFPGARPAAAVAARGREAAGPFPARIWLCSGAICWCRCSAGNHPPGRAQLWLGLRPAKGKARKHQPQPKLRFRKALLYPTQGIL